MSHPIGTHIAIGQEHELNYWLRNKGFQQSRENRKLLLDLISRAKTAVGKSSNEHLEHDELNTYYATTKNTWLFAIS